MTRFLVHSSLILIYFERIISKPLTGKLWVMQCWKVSTATHTQTTWPGFWLWGSAQSQEEHSTVVCLRRWARCLWLGGWNQCVWTQTGSHLKAEVKLLVSPFIFQFYRHSVVTQHVSDVTSSTNQGTDVPSKWWLLGITEQFANQSAGLMWLWRKPIKVCLGSAAVRGVLVYTDTLE